MKIPWHRKQWHLSTNVMRSSQTYDSVVVVVVVAVVAMVAVIIISLCLLKL